MGLSIAVIILNYRRPQNIGAIAAAAREALQDAPIFILDQADTDDLRERRDIPWSEVWLQRAAVNQGAGARVALASRLPFDLYIAIDDDTFLTPGQIARLAERLRAEPDRAHGVWGERLELDAGMIAFRTAIRQVDAAVSTLNQVYAFSGRQAAAAIELAARLGYDAWSGIGPVDDILLSCGSAKPPLCHDLGPIGLCPTAGERGIAVWMSEGFRERRLELAGRLIAARSIAVFSPMTFQDGPP